MENNSKKRKDALNASASSRSSRAGSSTATNVTSRASESLASEGSISSLSQSEVVYNSNLLSSSEQDVMGVSHFVKNCVCVCVCFFFCFFFFFFFFGFVCLPFLQFRVFRLPPLWFQIRGISYKYFSCFFTKTHWVGIETCLFKASNEYPQDLFLEKLE